MTYKTKTLISHLAAETWMKPCYPNGFDKWLAKHIEEEEIMEHDGEDLKDPSDLDETELMWLFVAFLLEKKYITEAKAKKLCEKNEFGTSMSGEWKELAIKRLGVKFTK